VNPEDQMEESKTPKKTAAFEESEPADAGQSQQSSSFSPSNTHHTHRVQEDRGGGGGRNDDCYHVQAGGARGSGSSAGEQSVEGSQNTGQIVLAKRRRERVRGPSTLALGGLLSNTFRFGSPKKAGGGAQEQVCQKGSDDVGGGLGQGQGQGQGEKSSRTTPSISPPSRDLRRLQEGWGARNVQAIFEAHALLQGMATLLNWLREVQHHFLSNFGNLVAFSKLPLKDLLSTLKDILNKFLATAKSLMHAASNLNSTRGYRWHRNLRVTENEFMQASHHITEAISRANQIEQDHLDYEAQMRRVTHALAHFAPFISRVDKNLPRIQVQPTGMRVKPKGVCTMPHVLVISRSATLCVAIKRLLRCSHALFMENCKLWGWSHYRHIVIILVQTVFLIIGSRFSIHYFWVAV